MDVKPTNANEKKDIKNPQRPPMNSPRMPMSNHNKGPKPGSNFAKPTRVMRAAKGR